MNTTYDDVEAERCSACGDAIGDEEWLYDDRSVGPDEQDSPVAYIHDRCAG